MTIQILTAGRYPNPLPVTLKISLEAAILQHMKAYGVQDCVVITRDDDFKRAAAPDLYEALLECLDCLEPPESSNVGAILKARAALAKARGEQAGGETNV